ncbi:MAG: outer membrane lipoprotein carrier protein LolA [Candidatus Desulfovibrio kirbyi]|uniref:Outer-membrane lipoprotein carrier protein n=1 Tax=Candidatus Desulfovibrio kirbyi TaxID=2696086 RepID=A0A6L2R542_9BACT|nr:MAG: outer membrane lipoprotein carrier protein LolA [Candidatus Desulfovibrio kirbyi]
MRFFFTLTLLVFCLSPLSHAAALTDDIQQRYAQTTSFSANFEQTLTHKESGAIEKRRGVLLFQKPLLIRWTTEKPHTEILVATRQEIWDYLPDEEIVYKYPLDMLKDSGGIIQVLTGQAALTKDFEVKSDGTENGLAKLRLYPKKPTPQLVEAVIWVESGYIRRTAITDFYGNTNDVRFTTFTPNAKTKASDFTFTPPKDVEMEDRTSAKTQEKELFR